MNSEHGKQLGRAVDEIYALRAFAAFVSKKLEADLALKTYPASRRAGAEEIIKLADTAVKGGMLTALKDESISRETFDIRQTYVDAGIDPLLTNYQWLEQNGFVQL